LPNLRGYRVHQDLLIGQCVLGDTGRELWAKPRIQLVHERHIDCRHGLQDLAAAERAGGLLVRPRAGAYGSDQSGLAAVEATVVDVHGAAL
tara:strand:+ start:803 stop:1075 length:273 start_codon:yes stop_codon:yes gene_type:complete